MDVAELQRQVEYKFAPEPLLAVQALANTFAFEREEERLLDPESARRWLVDSDLAQSSVTVDDCSFEQLVGFRTLVRNLLEANLDAERPAGLAELAEVAGTHPAPLAVDPEGVIALDLDPPASVDGVIAQLLGIVFHAGIEDQWRRLKVCASDECRWAFYDTSKNRGGTWCSMEVCGNRIKNRRYRDRRAGARAE